MREASSDVGTHAVTRAPIRSYRDVEAFQRSMSLLAPLHELLRKLPHDERWELASRLRRASKSIPANIAEGYGKKRSAKDFRAYLDTALGSCNEVIVHLELAVAVSYFTQADIADLVREYEIVAKQLYRLIESWQDFGMAGRDRDEGGSRFPLHASRFP